ncbi:hypothetical protein, partial [Glaciihabitans sp. UYNi722]|uniref:hypothetical protein n=1 Tax=Glaciihabitans sp. UYNi722 TaxID=3156344 RepID=UPI00339404AC
MLDILGGWDLEGAIPTGFGLAVTRNYIAGETDLVLQSRLWAVSAGFVVVAFRCLLMSSAPVGAA